MTYINQSIYSSVIQPAVTWRNDYRLDKPYLLGPFNGANVCSEAFQFISGSGTGIILLWRTVPSADFYVVQWCRNSSFSGPTIRTALVASPATQYELNFATDIRIGVEYFWRVVAYAEDGGVSDTSDAWSFTFDCPSIENPNDVKELSPYYQDTPLCDFFNVNLGLNGPDKADCCSKEKYTVDVQWDCLTPDGNSVTIQNIDWSVTGNAGVTLTTPDNQDYAIVDISIRASEKFTIKVCVRFGDGADLVFECCDSIDVIVDCDTESKGRVCIYPWPGLIRAIDPAFVDPPQQSSVWFPGSDILEQGALGSDSTFWVGGFVFESSVLSDPAESKGYDPAGDFICVDGFYGDPENRDKNTECVDRGQDSLLLHEARIPIPIGCTLTTEYGFLDVDFYRIAGGGLSWNPETCKLNAYTGYGYFPDIGCGLLLINNELSVDIRDLIGPGLEFYQDCRMKVAYGCGLTFDEQEQLTIYTGCGLACDTVSGELGVYVGCGLTCYEATGELRVNTEDLAGECLEAGYPCTLNVISRIVELVTDVYCEGGQIYAVKDNFRVLDC